MAATITGIIYYDLNHNGQYDTGEPGIPGVFIVLANAGGCVTAQTDANGIYNFTVTTAGAYTVYEPVISPTACPPTEFAQPDGFTMSNGPRKLAVTVTQAQINNAATINGQNFSHDTINSPLSCNTRMVQFVGRPTSWYDINIVTGQPALHGTLSPAQDVNAIGYNPLDDYIYGYSQTTNNLVRVDSAGNLVQLPRPTGLPANNYNTGTFDLNGFLYLFINDTNRFYTVDLRPNSPTFMKLVNPATGYTEQTANFGTALSTTVNISDWVYDARDGNLYGILRNGVLTRIAPTTGQVTNLNTTAPNPDASFGAMAIDQAGTIYAIANNDGTIYKYTFSGNTATGVPFSTTYFASFNDGTMCPSAVVRVDYGDAPDISSATGSGDYNTLLANNGPRHEIVNALYLGTRVTAEADAYQHPTAAGDDLTLGIQDDGLAVPLAPLSLSAATYTLPVTVTNETGLTANLYGWIDFNQNGVFEANEAAPVAAVPSAVGTQVHNLAFSVPAGTVMAAGNTFVRLRLTTDNLVSEPGPQDFRSLGPASDGEVEDYVLAVAAVADLAVDKSSDRANLTTGDLITYTIVVNNLGPDAAMDVNLTDDLPASLAGTQYSLDGGANWQPWPGSLMLGTFAPGASQTVLLRGTYTGGVNGAVVNTAQVSTSSLDPDLGNNTSTVITPASPSADLAITKTASPAAVTAGQLLTYTLRVTNAGPDPAQSALLSDPIASVILNPEFSLDGSTWLPWPGTYALGDLPVGADLTLFIRGIVLPAATQSIVNTATVSSLTPDPDLTNNAATVETPVSALADISVVKLGSPKPVRAGELLTYTLVVANAGPSTAEAVALNDVVPGELVNPEFSTDNGLTWQPWPGSYSVGTMAPGAAVTVQLRGTVSSAAENILNTATVNSVTPDPNPANNTDNDVTPVDVSADLAVTKLAEPSPVSAGGLVTFTIIVTNSGPSDAQSVTLTDSLPTAITGAMYSLDGGSSFQPWTGALGLGALANGASRSILIRGTVAGTAAGTLDNTAIVNSPTPDPNPDNNQDTVIVPIDTAADLAVIKTGSPSPAIRGQLLIYSIAITNHGPDPALNSVLSDGIPSELTGAEYSVNGGTTWQAWAGSYAAGTLAPGEVRQVLIRGTVSPTASGLIENTAVISSDTPDPNPNNNQSTELIPVGSAADLAVVKAAAPIPVRAGELLTYTITVSNAGPDAAVDALLADILPAEIINPEVSVQDSTFVPWTTPYPLGTLAAGESLTLRIRGTIASSTLPTVIVNTATASSATPDPDPANNSDTAETNVIAAADLAVTKVGNTAAVPGEQFGYTLTVANAGPSDALDVLLTDAIPNTLFNPEFSSDGGVTYAPWNSPYALGMLAAGTVRTILIRGTLSPSAIGTILNTAVVSSPTPDPNPDNNTDTDETPVQPTADLSILKSGSPNPVPAGGLIHYALQVANAGPAAAENVILTDALPPELSNPQFSVDGGINWFSWNGFLALGTLQAGELRIIVLRAMVSQAALGVLRNIATVASDTPDPNPANNTDTHDTPIAPAADLAVQKSVYPSTVQRGGELTYTIVVTNRGPADALDVSLEDDLSPLLTNAQFSPDGGATWRPWRSPYSLGNLLVGQSVTILIRATVSPTAMGSIVNTAVVTSPTPDPDPTNNRDTVETALSPSADLSILKQAQANVAVPGGLLTYTLTIVNNGPDAAQDAILYDAVPSELTGVQISLDNGATWLPWNNPYALGPLAPGAIRTILLRGTVLADCGTISNTAVIASTTPDPKPDNNTSTAETPIESTPTQADLAIRKAACPIPAVRCRCLNYTLTVTNAGPSRAEQVTVTDVLPPELNNGVFSLDCGKTWQPWNGSYTLGILDAGMQVTLLIAGVVGACVNGPIQNTASVSSATPDPNPANNVFRLSVPVQPCTPCPKQASRNGCC